MDKTISSVLEEAGLSPHVRVLIGALFSFELNGSAHWSIRDDQTVYGRILGVTVCVPKGEVILSTSAAAISRGRLIGLTFVQSDRQWYGNVKSNLIRKHEAYNGNLRLL
jgi:hypothetical protein